MFIQNWHGTCLYTIFQDKSILNGFIMIMKMLLDTLSDLAKLNHGEYSKYQLCSPKIDMAHVYILLFKDI